eukprot:gene13251-16902_t
MHPALRGFRVVSFDSFFVVHWQVAVAEGEEHHAVRTDVGMFDVAHMCVVDIKGDNTRAFLRGLLANNVDKLQVSGKALYSCMLNPQGFVIDDLIVYFINEGWFRLVVNAGTAEKDVAWMQAQNEATGSGVSITQRRDGANAMALIAVQGPNARAKVLRAKSQCAPMVTKHLHLVFGDHGGALTFGAQDLGA